MLLKIIMTHEITNGLCNSKCICELTTLNNDYEEVQISVPWGHITGKWWGPRNTQPILALHGWQDNCGTFDNLAPILREKGLSIYCIDLPGHGFSSQLPPGQHYYLFWDGVHYLRRIIKHFTWNNITIIGHSLGGAIAFLYAAVYPDDVKKYVSIDISSPSVRSLKRMCDQAGPSIDKFLSYENKPIDQMPCYNYEEMVDILFSAHAGSITRVNCEVMLRRGIKPAANKKGFVFTRDPRLKTAALGFMTIDQILELASRIKCEVMNIKASTGIKLDHPEYYDLVLDTIEKQAKVVERHNFNGTHHLHLNDAESIAPNIHRFLIA